MSMKSLPELAYEYLISVNNDLNQYTSEKGEVIKLSDGAILVSPHYVHFAKNGRGAGGMPPIDIIHEWMGKKGIIGDRGDAYMISRAIGRRGTLNYNAGAPNAISEALKNNAANYNSRLSDYILTYVRDKQGREDLFIPEF